MSRYAALEISIRDTLGLDAPLAALANTIGVMAVRPNEMDLIDTAQVQALNLPAVLIDADMDNVKTETATTGSVDYYVPVTIKSFAQHTVEATAKTNLNAIIDALETVLNANDNSVDDFNGSGWVMVDAAVTKTKVLQASGGFIAWATTTFTVTKNVLT